MTLGNIPRCSWSGPGFTQMVRCIRLQDHKGDHWWHDGDLIGQTTKAEDESPSATRPGRYR